MIRIDCLDRRKICLPFSIVQIDHQLCIKRCLRQLLCLLYSALPKVLLEIDRYLQPLSRDVSDFWYSVNMIEIKIIVIKILTNVLYTSSIVILYIVKLPLLKCYFLNHQMNELFRLYKFLYNVCIQVVHDLSLVVY